MSQDARTALAEFAQSRDEAAFRRVVDEFGGLVLRAAFRRTSDQGLAEEVAQNVFAIMARKAKRVARHASISGWVFTTVRLEAAKALRGRQRHRRKLDALADELQSATNEKMSDDDLEQWREALPHLEHGLDTLGDAEREILLARFFEGKSFAEIAAETGKSEAACKMRVRRSLDKLNGWMGRRGVAISATVLATGLSAEWVKAAPSIVSAAISSNAVAAAPAVGAGTLLTNTLLTMNAAKTAGVAAAAILAIGSVPVLVQHSEAKALKTEVAGLRGQVSALHEAGEGAAPSGLADRGGRGTPAQRFLAGAKTPDDPKAFVDQLLAAVMEQNMVAMVKALIPLSKMTPEEIEQLMADVRESDASEPGKQMVMPMLMAFAADKGDDPTAVLDRAIETGVPLTSLMGKMSKWAKEDPNAAVAWFRERRDAGLLAGKGVDDEAERYALMAILPTLARSDPKMALTLVDELDEDSREEGLANVIAADLTAGIGGGELGRDLLLAIENGKERLGAFGFAMNRAPDMDMDKAAAFAGTLGFSAEEHSRALAGIVGGRWNMPLEERGEWLAAQIGTGPADGMREFASGLTRGGTKPEDVTAWVESLPAGPVRDHALLGEVEGSMGMRGRDAANFARALQISDPDQREAMAVKALMFWRSRDREAAEAAAAEAGVNISGVSVDR